MRSQWIAVFAFGLMLAGCSQQASQPAQAPEVPYDTSVPIKEFMGHVMQHATDEVWKWQGYKSDASGEHSLFPKNDAEWEQAESGSMTLAEITNVLLIPGRRMDGPEWTGAVLKVRLLARQAAAAAEKHDQKAFFEVGAQLDEACEGCHRRYLPGYVAGNK